VTVNGGGRPFKTGKEMRDLGVIKDVCVFVEDGIIRWIGSTGAFGLSLNRDADVIDASSLVALPGFVDSHTHALFAGSREREFAMRAEGKTYQEIAAEGGGIASTVASTRATSKKELKKLTSKRLDSMMKHGTTTVEIKSGYGLDPDTEVKMLEAIKELADEHFMTIAPTFLGAHAVPSEYAQNKDAYVELVCEHMLPYVARKNLARFCDVFCEQGYFTLEESRRILERAKSLGLQLKIHADEFNAIGGTRLAAELGALSVDHLEHIQAEGIKALRGRETIAVVLPGVSFFLRNPYAPARALIDAEIPVAIASDFNPGSCMAFSMPLMMTIACTQMSLTPEEAICAATLNGAAALGLSSILGSIEVGKQADIILYDIPDYRYLAYHFGTNLVATVIKKGTILEFS